MKSLPLALLILSFAANCQATTVSVPLIPPSVQGSDYNSLNQTTSGGAVLNILTGTAPFTCSITVGSIPTGLTLSEVTPNGGSPIGLCIVTGTPSTAGDYTFTVQATDAGSASASASVTFEVMSTSLPVISAISAVQGGSPDSEVITWTTNVAASSRVAYGYNFWTQQTAETDTAGVTSHSVTLTGLLINQSYLFVVISRGISGGVPKQYLFSYVQNNPFTAGPASSGGAFSMTVLGVGPHNIIQGFPLYVAVYASPITGTASFTSVKYQVTGIPTNTKVHWPDQQDDGSGQCNVSTTTTADDSLTCSSFNNTQFEILANVGGTTPIGSYTLTFTATPNTGTGANFTWPMSVATASFSFGTPSSYPTIPSLALWKSNMVVFGGYPVNITQVTVSGNNVTITANNTYGTFFPVDIQFSGLTNATFLNGLNVRVVTANATSFTFPLTHANYGPAADTGTASGHWYLDQHANGTACGGFDDQCVQYYDGQKTYYKIQAYDAANGLTSNPALWVTAANNSKTQYANAVNAETPPGNGLQGYRVFPHGLYQDCVTNGVAASCTLLSNIVTNPGYSTLISNTLPFADGLNIREACYFLGAKRLAYDNSLSGATLAQVNALAAYCIGEVDEIVNGVNNGVGIWDQPFMGGLLAQALIEYYNDPLTGNGDVRVPPALKLLADYMWANEWVPWSGGNGNFFYRNSDWNFGLATNPSIGTAGGSQGLNLLIAPLYAWLYSKTGNQQYLLEGDTIWYAGVNDPPQNGVGFAGKNFSQQYRWSFDYVTYRSAPSNFYGIATRSTMIAQAW